MEFNGSPIQWEGPGVYGLYNEDVWGKVNDMETVEFLLQNDHELAYVNAWDVTAVNFEKETE